MHFCPVTIKHAGSCTFTIPHDQPHWIGLDSFASLDQIRVPGCNAEYPIAAQTPSQAPLQGQQSEQQASRCLCSPCDRNFTDRHIASSTCHSLSSSVSSSASLFASQLTTAPTSSSIFRQPTAGRATRYPRSTRLVPVWLSSAGLSSERVVSA
jgi:hypothetical protein